MITREYVGKVFGESLRRVREEEELTQIEMTRRMSQGAGSVSRIERGARLPDVCTLVKLAVALRAPLYDLIEPLEQLVIEELDRLDAHPSERHLERQLEQEEQEQEQEEDDDLDF